MAELNFLSEFIKEEIYLVDRVDKNSSTKQTEIEQYLIVTADSLSDIDRAFLDKIFQAVNIAPEQLKLSQNDSNSKDYLGTFYFGTAPTGETLTPYQMHTVQGKPVIVAHSLSEIAADNKKKRKLWSVLQACFN